MYRLTLFIYSSEIVNTISRMLQVTKYFYKDESDNKDYSISIDNQEE